MSQKEPTDNHSELGYILNFDDSNGQLPEGVVHRESYEEWKKFALEFYNDPNNPYTTSEGVVIDMKAGTWRCKSVIEKIKDEEEKKKLFDILDKYNVLRGKMIALKKKAFGIVRAKPGDPKTSKKSILDSRRTEILELFGKFYNLNDVHRFIAEEFGLIVSEDTLGSFRNQHIDQIKELQEEYKRDYSTIRLTHKRSRLEELNELYQDRKHLYTLTKSTESYRLLLITLEQIKKEVEGDLLVVQGNIDVNIETTINIHIQQEIIKSLAIKDIILSRVAARLGKNPMYLINRLHNSYYSKFNGFGEPDEDIQNNQPTFPSQIIYNFDEIRPKVELNLAEKKRLEEFPPLSEDVTQLMLENKNDIVELIKKKRQNIENNKEKIDNLEKEKENKKNT